MSENNKNVFEELREIAENTLRVYQSGLIQENKRESNEATRISNEATRESNETTRQGNEATRISNETTRQGNEATRISNENARIINDEIRDIKISKIEYLIGDVGKAVDDILAIQANLIGGNL